jgi:hypothetical protein
MNKHTGLAALRGWRGAVANWIVPPVARRTSIDEETLRASVGFFFLALSAYYLLSTARRVAGSA